MADGFFLGEIKPEFILQLSVHISMFEVFDIGVYHESHEIENQVGRLAKDAERRKAKVFKSCVVG